MGFSFSFGVIIAIVAAFLGYLYVVQTYLVGALYSLWGYVFFESCVENLGSLFWEEDEMPSEPAPWMYVFAPFCPIVLLIVVVACMIIGCIMYMCMSVFGHTKSA